jgi:hypothetical protein
LEGLKKWQDEGVWNRILKELASIREHGIVAVDRFFGWLNHSGG